MSEIKNAELKYICTKYTIKVFTKLWNVRKQANKYILIFEYNFISYVIYL